MFETLEAMMKPMRAWSYGMTVAQARVFFAEHGYKCAICGELGNPLKRGMGLVIDHDHACCPPPTPTVRDRQRSGYTKPTPTCGKCNRGLLCYACNAGIGQFKDDPELLRAAIAYLGRVRTQ